MKKISPIQKVVYIIFIFLFISILGVLGKDWAFNIFQSSENISIEPNDWKIQRISYSGLFVETPFILKENPLIIPKKYKSMIKDMITYQYASTPLDLSVNYMVFNDDIIPNLDGAAKMAINNMRATRGVEDFAYSISNMYKGNLNGRLIKGSFNIRQQSARFIGNVFVKDTRTWQVLCVFFDNNKNNIIVNRIINSISITF